MYGGGSFCSCASSLIRRLLTRVGAAVDDVPDDCGERDESDEEEEEDSIADGRRQAEATETHTPACCIIERQLQNALYVEMRM